MATRKGLGTNSAPRSTLNPPYQCFVPGSAVCSGTLGKHGPTSTPVSPLGRPAKHRFLRRSFRKGYVSVGAVSVVRGTLVGEKDSGLGVPRTFLEPLSSIGSANLRMFRQIRRFGLDGFHSISFGFPFVRRGSQNFEF